MLHLLICFSFEQFFTFGVIYADTTLCLYNKMSQLCSQTKDLTLRAITENWKLLGCDFISEFLAGIP